VNPQTFYVIHSAAELSFNHSQFHRFTERIRTLSSLCGAPSAVFLVRPFVFHQTGTQFPFSTNGSQFNHHFSLPTLNRTPLILKRDL
jgi:hypothetical protein